MIMTERKFLKGAKSSLFFFAGGILLFLLFLLLVFGIFGNYGK